MSAFLGQNISDILAFADTCHDMCGARCKIPNLQVASGQCSTHKMFLLKAKGFEGFASINTDENAIMNQMAMHDPEKYKFNVDSDLILTLDPSSTEVDDVPLNDTMMQSKTIKIMFHRDKEGRYKAQLRKILLQYFGNRLGLHVDCSEISFFNGFLDNSDLIDNEPVLKAKYNDNGIMTKFACITSFWDEAAKGSAEELQLPKLNHELLYLTSKNTNNERSNKRVLFMPKDFDMTISYSKDEVSISIDKKNHELLKTTFTLQNLKAQKNAELSVNNLCMLLNSHANEKSAESLSAQMQGIFTTFRPGRTYEIDLLANILYNLKRSCDYAQIYSMQYFNNPETKAYLPKANKYNHALITFDRLCFMKALMEDIPVIFERKLPSGPCELIINRGNLEQPKFSIKVCLDSIMQIINKIEKEISYKLLIQQHATSASKKVIRFAKDVFLKFFPFFKNVDINSLENLSELDKIYNKVKKICDVFSKQSGGKRKWQDEDNNDYKPSNEHKRKLQKKTDDIFTAYENDYSLFNVIDDIYYNVYDCELSFLEAIPNVIEKLSENNEKLQTIQNETSTEIQEIQETQANIIKSIYDILFILYELLIKQKHVNYVVKMNHVGVYKQNYLKRLFNFEYKESLYKAIPYDIHSINIDHAILAYSTFIIEVNLLKESILSMQIPSNEAAILDAIDVQSFERNPMYLKDIKVLQKQRDQRSQTQNIMYGERQLTATQIDARTVKYNVLIKKLVLLNKCINNLEKDNPEFKFFLSNSDIGRLYKQINIPESVFSTEKRKLLKNLVRTINNKKKPKQLQKTKAHTEFQVLKIQGKVDKTKQPSDLQLLKKYISNKIKLITEEREQVEKGDSKIVIKTFSTLQRQIKSIFSNADRVKELKSLLVMKLHEGILSSINGIQVLYKQKSKTLEEKINKDQLHFAFRARLRMNELSGGFLDNMYYEDIFNNNDDDNDADQYIDEDINDSEDSNSETQYSHEAINNNTNTSIVDFNLYEDQSFIEEVPLDFFGMPDHINNTYNDDDDDDDDKDYEDDDGDDDDEDNEEEITIADDLNLYVKDFVELLLPEIDVNFKLDFKIIVDECCDRIENLCSELSALVKALLNWETENTIQGGRSIFESESDTIHLIIPSKTLWEGFKAVEKKEEKNKRNNEEIIDEKFIKFSDLKSIRNKKYSIFLNTLKEECKVPHDLYKIYCKSSFDQWCEKIFALANKDAQVKTLDAQVKTLVAQVVRNSIWKSINPELEQTNELTNELTNDKPNSENQYLSPDYVNFLSDIRNHAQFKFHLTCILGELKIFLEYEKRQFSLDKDLVLVQCEKLQKYSDYLNSKYYRSTIFEEEKRYLEIIDQLLVESNIVYSLLSFVQSFK